MEPTHVQKWQVAGLHLDMASFFALDTNHDSMVSFVEILRALFPVRVRMRRAGIRERGFYYFLFRGIKLFVTVCTCSR